MAEKPNQALQLAGNQVHLWCVATSAVPTETLWTCLDADEQGRIERLRDASKRRQKLASRVLLRQLLSAYLTIDPADIKLWYGPLGRPHLDHDVHATRLNFNVSHSDGLIAITLARTPLLGIDIELQRDRVRFDRLLERCYSSREQRYLLSLSDSEQFQTQFFRAWTAKEALLKSTGAGIFHAASTIDLNLSTQELSLHHAEDTTLATHQWQLIDFDPCDQPDMPPLGRFSGTVAIADGKWQLKRLTYPADLNPKAG